MNGATELKLGGIPILISAERAAYVEVRNSYRELARDAVVDFRSRLAADFRDFDSLRASLAEFLDEHVEVATDKGVTDLITHGIYDVDEDAFQAGAWDTATKVREIVEGLEAMALQTEGDADSYSAAAQDARQSEGPVVGGGIGLEGAAGGIILAGIANSLIKGTQVASLSLAAKLSKIAGRAKRSEIYADPEFQKALEGSVFALIESAHWSFVKEMEKNRDRARYNYPSESDKSSCAAIVKNIETLKVSPQDVPHVAAKAICLNPYNCRIFELFVLMHGDPLREIDKLASFFGIDLTQFKQDRLVDLEHRTKLVSSMQAAKLCNSIEELARTLGTPSAQAASRVRVIESALRDEESHVIPDIHKNELDPIKRQKLLVEGLSDQLLVTRYNIEEVGQGTEKPLLGPRGKLIGLLLFIASGVANGLDRQGIYASPISIVFWIGFSIFAAFFVYLTASVIKSVLIKIWHSLKILELRRDERALVAKIEGLSGQAT